MFADAFAAHAERACLRDAARELSYAEVLALGGGLIAGLPAARCLVVLRCSVTIEAVAAYAALIDAGHVPLLLEAGLAGDLADRIIAAYRPDAVVDPGAGSVRLLAGGTELHRDLALLLTTSGSTGSPKLVRLTAAGMRHNAGAIGEYLALDAGERAFLHLPMSYSYGLSVIHSHWQAGASLCLTQRSVMEAGYWEELGQHGATSISGVPFHYATIRRLGEARLEIPSLRTLTQAGGRLDPRVVAHFGAWAARTGRRFVVMYGQTEAGPRIAWLPPEHAVAAPEAIGVAIPGVAITLCDEMGNAVADGEAGEVIVRSPAVMLGYAQGAADLARGDEMGGRLATGDLAVRGPDGLLRITGRASRLLKIYGLRINIDEIERQLGMLGHSALCFGEDDRLRVLIEGEGDPAALRETIVQLFSLPPRGLEVRATSVPVERSAAGKLEAARLANAWEAAA